jgi:hypothetical protein
VTVSPHPRRVGPGLALVAGLLPFALGVLLAVGRAAGDAALLGQLITASAGAALVGVVLGIAGAVRTRGGWRWLGVAGAVVNVAIGLGLLALLRLAGVVAARA